ncbi:MAG: restriction endonuclease subunit S [Actinobacteria bacterium]|nr:restriction endonuclease subunit S [Actinomycetota bacterium]
MNHLPKGWKSVPLGDLCDLVQYGFTAKASKEPVGPKFLRITDIVPERISWEDVPFCELDDSAVGKYLLQPGDIVIARTGATTGYAKRIKKPLRAIFASYLVRLRIKDDVDNRYIGLVVESDFYKRFIQTNIGGAAQPNANAKILTSFPVPLPPLKDQQIIASILSAYDDLIENNTRRIRILEEMAQSLYREWFVYFRFPGHEKVKLVNSAVGNIPEGWQLRKLGDACIIIMGQSPKSEFYNEDGDGLPFHQGVRDFGSRFPLDRLFCTVTNRIAEAGDILFSVRAPVGRINLTNKKIAIGRGLSAIRSKESWQAFVFQQLKDKFHEEDIIGGGTIFKSVTKADMHNIDFISPPSSLIIKFENIVSPIYSAIEYFLAENVNLCQMRDILLPRLIAGEIGMNRISDQ